MNKAPERIRSWQGVDPLTDEELGLELCEYIRADIHEARVKELEDKLAEVLKKIGDLDKFIERVTST